MAFIDDYHDGVAPPASLFENAAFYNRVLALIESMTTAEDFEFIEVKPILREFK